MLNIVIPMAGRGSRFANAGYKNPKPFIDVHGKPMIEVVVKNLTPKQPHRFIFVCQRQHVAEYDLEKKLGVFSPHCEIVCVDGITEGQLCTVMAARHLIDNDEPLMTANSDQYIDININDYLKFMDDQALDGLIMTMKADDPKWSYVRSKEGFVVETAEKKIISDDASVGIFNFRHGSDFIYAAEKMIADDIRTNGEFYICPCYNYLVAKGKKIGQYGIGEEYNGMYGLGIPSDLDFFLKHHVSEKVK